MAGHSKWANIKHRKGKQDEIRGRIFSRLARGITIATKQGGPDPDHNALLRLAIEKARAANMTKDKIHNAIKKGAGTGEAANIDEVRYEGYGPNGVAVIIDCMTDNRNRTVAEIRHAFSKTGGNLGTEGSVAYLFNKRGIIEFATTANEEKVMDAALNAGAEDVVMEAEGTVKVLTAAEEITQIKEQLEAVGLMPDSFEVTLLPTTKISLDDKGAEKMEKLFELLEVIDDVQEVYSNADMPEEDSAELSND
ncbi:MAG: YebC/PmpR family DNA-binding transcriptional regulator [Gammaproteobacteria bacterium]|nr:YebC/PmpR family DNA-binding transcriptional regulator [Gammaproteobacteria bacterium]